MKEKRFEKYDEAMAYLSNVFNLAGFFDATLIWSNRHEFEERPYRLILKAPDGKMLKDLRDKI